MRIAAGPEFDDLWESSPGIFGASLVRNRDWLTWRYQSHPDVNYRIFALRLNGSLYGWVVLRADQFPAGRVVTICDWFYKTDSTLWVAFMFKVLQSVDYQDAIVRLWSCDNTPFVKDLWRLFTLGGAYLNLIFKPLPDGESVFNSPDVFGEFSIGHSDNV